MDKPSTVKIQTHYLKYDGDTKDISEWAIWYGFQFSVYIVSMNDDLESQKLVYEARSA